LVCRDARWHVLQFYESQGPNRCFALPQPPM
jgi:hypothetical protein